MNKYKLKTEKVKGILQAVFLNKKIKIEYLFLLFLIFSLQQDH